jgi:hypothetical protein
LVIVGRRLVRVAFALFKSKATYDERIVSAAGQAPNAGPAP